MKTKRRIIFFIGLTITISFFAFSRIVSHYLIDFSKNRAFVVAEEASEQQTLLVKKELEGAVSLSVLLEIAVQNVLIAETKDVVQIERLLQENLEHSPNLFATWVVWEEDLKKTGKGYYTAFFNRKGSAIVKDSLFFDRHRDKAYPTLKKSTSSLIIPHFFYDPSSLFSSSLISFATPIIIDGEYRGAVGVDLQIDKLQELIKDIDIIKVGYASLLNEDFKFVGHGNETMIGQSLYEFVSEKEIEDIQTALFKNKKFKGEHISATMPDSEYRIYNPVQIENTKQTWYFVVNIPMKKIMQPAEKIANYTLVASVIAVIVILIILNIVISYVVDPIVQMAKMLGDLAHGRPVVDEIKFSLRDEIGEMNHNFVKLVKALEEKAKAEKALVRAKDTAENAKYKLQMLNRELEVRVEHRTASLAKEIEERKSAQGALQESEASYKNLVRNSFQGLIIYDGKQILFANQRLLEIFSRREDEILGMTLDEYYRMHHPEEAYLIHKKLKMLERDPNFTDRQVYRVIQKNGAIRWVEDYSTSIMYKGKPAVQVVMLDIHERKLIEKDLAEYRKFLKRIIDNNPNLIYVHDLQGRYVLANKAMADLYNVELDDMIGKSFNDLNTDNRQLADYQKYDELARETLKPQTLPITNFVDASGHTTYYQAVKVPLLNSNGVCQHTLTVVTDITNRLKAEEKAKQSEASIRQILDTIHDAIILHDRDLNIVYTNKKIEALFGITSDEAKSMKLTDLAPRRMSYARVVKVFRNLRFDEPRFFDLRGVKPKTKEVFDVEVFISKVNVFGGDYYLSAIRDITERKHFETALEKAKVQAEEANKSKSDFLANMSHEIRTPMNAIVGFTELLEKTEMGKKQYHYLDSIKMGSQSLMTVINDILDLSNIEAGMLDIKPEPINTALLFNEIESIFKLKVREKELEFKLDVAADIPQSLMLDQVRLRQVIFNVIGNAIKFTDAGYVKLTARRIDIEENSTKINLEITIEDTGIGIPEEQHATIFDSFNQGSTNSMRKFGGTGLGLSISKRLLGMMGGDISVQSDGLTGSKFNITLYGTTISDEQPHNQSAPERLAGEIAFEPATVLIVDDIKTNREYLLEGLRHAPFKLVTAADGQEGVEMTRNYQPDVILMDIRMPKLDGYMAVERIKENPTTKHCKVIAMTATVFGNEKKKIDAYRFDGFLRKPIYLDDLYETLAQYLPHKRVHSQESLDKLVRSAEIQPRTAKEAIELLELKVLTIWKEAKQNEMSEDIANFANRVMKIAERTQVQILHDYAQKLQIEVENFELEKMSLTLHSFDMVLQQIRDAANSGANNL